jgi:hypothetical protein
MLVDVVKVDCSGVAEGVNPVAVLRESQYPAGVSAWYVANGPVNGNALRNPIDWTIVTANSELIRIPLYSYVMREKLEACFAAGVAMGYTLSEEQTKAAERLIIAVGDAEVVDDPLNTRMWLGLAALCRL